jgi:soluble lytic murein transglycosylase-like protein
MDGTGVVAAIILLFFIFNFKPAQNTTINTSPADQYAYYQMDKSETQYQQVGEDRMQRIIRKYNSDISQSEIDRIKIATNIYSKEQNIDPRLILAVMARESRFNSRAVSPSGARGLGQIMPANFSSLGITDPENIDQNIRGLTKYLRQKLDEWQDQADQIGLALASYLEGSGSIKRNNNSYTGHTATYVNDILKIRSMI